MTETKVLLAGMVVLSLVGCGSIPTNNLNHSPISIKADGETYVTCDSYSLSEDGGGKSSYSLSFTDADADGAKVILKGVEKLKIIELPQMITASMPSVLPDIKTDHLSDGSSYKEGQEYTWKDGTQAKVLNGQWGAIKEKNPVCGAK
jgi:hypothetical protein